MRVSSVVTPSPTWGRGEELGASSSQRTPSPFEGLREGRGGAAGSPPAYSMRGEGWGEGATAVMADDCAARTSPLSLSLSPPGRGEGLRASSSQRTPSPFEGGGWGE